MPTNTGTPNGQTLGCVQIWPYDNTYYPPFQTQTATWPWWPVEPLNCIGKAHVFECDHVEACKCGAVKRVMPKAKKSR